MERFHFDVVKPHTELQSQFDLYPTKLVIFPSSARLSLMSYCVYLVSQSPALDETKLSDPCDERTSPRSTYSGMIWLAAGGWLDVDGFGRYASDEWRWVNAMPTVGWKQFFVHVKACMTECLRVQEKIPLLKVLENVLAGTKPADKSKTTYCKHIEQWKRTTSTYLSEQISAETTDCSVSDRSSRAIASGTSATIAPAGAVREEADNGTCRLSDKKRREPNIYTAHHYVMQCFEGTLYTSGDFPPVDSFGFSHVTAHVHDAIRYANKRKKLIRI